MNAQDWRPYNEFIKDLVVWQCPSDKGMIAYQDTHVNVSEIKPSTWSQPRRGTSYEFNTHGVARRVNPPGPNEFNMNDNINNNASKIRQPNEFTIYYEYPMHDVNYGCLDGSSVGEPVYYFGAGHGGAANFHDPYLSPTSATAGFADGHAARLKGIRGEGRRQPGLYTIVQPK